MRALIVTCMRNEAPFLLEWIAYHRHLGFTDFLIYSNDCEDGTDLMLDRLAQLGIVAHERNRSGGKTTVQWRALKRARNHPLVAQADWIYGTDVDEFLCIHRGEGRLRDLLAAAPDAMGFAIPWRMFGNAGISQFHDTPMTEQFSLAAPERMLWPWRAVQFKSLYRNDARFNRLGIHRPRLKPGANFGLWLDGNGEPFEAPGTVLPSLEPRYGLAQINHYALGSAESFLVKTARGRPNRSRDPIDLAYWVERNFNTERDDRIKRHSAGIAAAMTELRQDHLLDRLHREGVAWRQRKIAGITQTEEGFYLLTCLMQAGDSRILLGAVQHRLFDRLLQIRKQAENTKAGGGLG